MKSGKAAYRNCLLRSLEEWIAKGKRVAIFGTGEHTDYLFRCVPELKLARIVGYLDGDEGRQGNRYRGMTIYPVEWAQRNADVILCSSFVNERIMATAAEGLGCKVALSHASSAPSRFSSAWIANRLLLSRDAKASGPYVEKHKSHDVLIFPMIDWNYRHQRPQQLAKRLAAAGKRVFYFRNRFSGSRRMPVRRALANLWTVELPGPQDFNLYHDDMVPFLAEAVVENVSLLRSEFRINEAIVLVQFPCWMRAAFELRKRFGWKTVYDCMDYHAGFANVSRMVLKDEQKLISGSDLIFASSHVLQEWILPRNKHCRLLPNAGEFEHFSRRIGSIPRTVVRLPHPIIGYYGAISHWFDARLVAAIARRRPDWTFVLAGNTQGADLGRLKELENVVFLTEQDYAGLPALLEGFDVCIIPFRKCRLTDAANPVKLYEYCARGKPIVASDLEELRRYREFVSLAGTVQEWIQAIEGVLRRRRPEDSKLRRTFARRNDWDERAKVMRREIEKAVFRHKIPKIE